MTSHYNIVVVVLLMTFVQPSALANHDEGHKE